MKKDCKIMLKNLQKEFKEVKNENVILKMFGERQCEIYNAIAKSEEYKEKSKKVSKVYNQLEEKYKNSSVILNSFERYADAIYSRVCISDKLLYKYGVMDGMRMIIDGLKDTDIKNI